MKKTFFLLTFLFTTLCLLISIHAQEDMVEIDNSVFETPQRPAAIFKHDSHNEKAGLEDCALCHHVYDEKGNLSEGQSSEDSKCADCHAIKASGSKPGLMKAFHLNCKGCHLAKKAGPILCGECHKNKDK
ncbi:MAG: cytochrome c3 family protein [Candidatus Magnetomorum sp.]|nr:cytochrome c3 family protein [Candidatus Magnetomorum sp.]